MTFPSLTLKAKKPPSPLYPKSLNTIGNHLKKAKLDRGLFQKQVAKEIVVDPFTVLNWETGATNPKFRYLAAIIQFLGYNPAPVDPAAPFHVRLKGRRLELGLSLKQLNLNETTIRKLETGRSKKATRETMKKVYHFIKLA